MGPVVGDGVERVASEFVDGLDLKATTTQIIQHHAIGAGRKAVAVREDDQGLRHVVQISLSCGVTIFFKAWARKAGCSSGVLV
jgi:hypothetical protein